MCSIGRILTELFEMDHLLHHSQPQPGAFFPDFVSLTCSKSSDDQEIKNIWSPSSLSKNNINYEPNAEKSTLPPPRDCMNDLIHYISDCKKAKGSDFWTHVDMVKYSTNLSPKAWGFIGCMWVDDAFQKENGKKKKKRGTTYHID